MEESNRNVDDLLIRLKEVYGAESDAELARSMGVSPAVIHNWRARGKVNLDVVVDRAQERGADVHWLLTGEERPTGRVRRIVVEGGERSTVVDVRPGDVLRFE